MSNNVVETNSRVFETLEKIFFGLFLFSIPLQTRLIFVTQETYGYGFFNEYATFFLYLSDILFIITLFLFFVNSLTKRVNFSKILKIKLSTYPLLIPLLALFLLIAWGFLSIYWSAYKEISFYKSLKFVEFGLLFLYIARRLRWFGLTKLLSVIFVTGFFQSIIGILQYLYQHSLILKILGESVLSPNIDNVAKIVVGGEKLIRAYGTFPHPNVFAGFLILSIFCSFWLIFSRKIKQNNQNVSSTYAFIKKLFHVKQFDSHALNKQNFDTDNASTDKRETILIVLLTIGIIVQLSALVLTFSRIAWLIMAFLALFFGFQLLKNSYLRQNLRQKMNYSFHPPAFLLKLFHVKQLPNYALNKPNKSMGEEISAGRRETFLILISILLIVVLLWPQINSRTIDVGNNYQQATSYRVLYNDIAINMIKQKPLIGIGNGSFTLKMADYSPEKLNWWQYQPAHNIYLLITSELGTVGLILFLFFIFSVLKMAYLKHKNQIVSSAFAKASADARLPAEASTDKNINQLKQNNKIVSRETILAIAKAGETRFLAKTQANETFLFNRLMFAIFIGFFFIGLFDHYFWTLQQGQLTFWLVLGALASLAKTKAEE